jgi:hypothetical protein
LTTSHNARPGEGKPAAWQLQNTQHG